MIVNEISELWHRSTRPVYRPSSDDLRKNRMSLKDLRAAGSAQDQHLILLLMGNDRHGVADR